MCSELTPRARIPDTRIPQLMQPCVYIENSLIALQADILNYLGEGAEGFQEYSDVFSWPRALWKAIKSSLYFQTAGTI